MTIRLSTNTNIFVKTFFFNFLVGDQEVRNFYLIFNDKLPGKFIDDSEFDEKCRIRGDLAYLSKKSPIMGTPLFY